jgi:hypothetical protein
VRAVAIPCDDLLGSAHMLPLNEARVVWTQVQHQRGFGPLSARGSSRLLRWISDRSDYPVISLISKRHRCNEERGHRSTAGGGGGGGNARGYFQGAAVLQGHLVAMSGAVSLDQKRATAWSHIEEKRVFQNGLASQAY